MGDPFGFKALIRAWSRTAWKIEIKVKIKLLSKKADRCLGVDRATMMEGLRLRGHHPYAEVLRAKEQLHLGPSPWNGESSMTKAKVVFGEDGKGNRFFKIGDWTRVTLVKAKNRDHAKNWAGCDVLRIQSYRNLASENVMMLSSFSIPPKLWTA